MRTVKDPEVRRQEIVTAAMRLFLEREYDNTTTGDVMQALGIAKGTIYHYFPSKEKLLEAVVDHMVDEYMEGRRAAVAACSGNALVKMRALFSPESRAGQATEQLHRQGNVKLHTRLLAVLIQRLGPLFGDLITQGCEEGLFHAPSPRETAELLLAGIQFLTDEGFYPWDEALVRRRMQAYPAIMEQLLGAASGTIDFLTPPDQKPPEQGTATTAEADTGETASS